MSALEAEFRVVLVQRIAEADAVHAFAHEVGGVIQCKCGQTLPTETWHNAPEVHREHRAEAVLAALQIEQVGWVEPWDDDMPPPNEVVHPEFAHIAEAPEGVYEDPYNGDPMIPWRPVFVLVQETTQ